MSEKQNTFEEDMKELEKLVERLEAGNLDLDESLRIYQEAIVIRDRCRKFLEESERKVQKLMETAQGVTKEEFKI